MRSVTRLVLLSLFLLSLALTALPALAAESGNGEEEPLPAEVIFEYEPAVVLESVPPAAEEQPWTTKFLVPTSLALATIAVFVTVIQYFVRVVRSRYKVVE
jgi:hypothetical protein